MSSYTRTYDIEAKQGDTWDGRQFVISKNGEALNLTGATITMQVRSTRTTPSIVMFVTPTQITLDAPLLGTFTVQPTVIAAAAGVYQYDIQIVWLSGVVKTYIGGQFTIYEDVTHG
jgi:hypothetical protein